MSSSIEIENTCILCGVCEAIAPKIFTQTTKVAVDEKAAKEDPVRLAICIEACPMESIKMVHSD